MNAKQRPITVMPLLHVTTPLDLLVAHAKQGSLAMVSLVLVSNLLDTSYFNENLQAKKADDAPSVYSSLFHN